MTLPNNRLDPWSANHGARRWVTTVKKYVPPGVLVHRELEFWLLGVSYLRGGILPESRGFVPRRFIAWVPIPKRKAGGILREEYRRFFGLGPWVGARVAPLRFRILWIGGQEQLVAQHKCGGLAGHVLAHHARSNVLRTVIFGGQFIFDVGQPDQFAQVAGDNFGPVLAGAAILRFE